MRSSGFILCTCLLAVAASPAAARIKVVATTASLGALAAEVGGPEVEVQVLAAATEDPHFVDPKPSLVLKLHQADLLITNGLGLESGWLPRLLVQARNPRILEGGAGSFDASTAVELLGAARADRAMGDVHPGGNPHFLLDARRGARLATALAERLATAQPSSAAALRARGASVSAELQRVAAEARSRAEKLPERARRIVAYHDSLAYLRDWLRLTEIATLEPKPGVAPDPAHVGAVLQKARLAGGKVILREEFYPSQTADAVARLAGGAVVVISGGPRPGESYSAWVHNLAQAVLGAAEQR